jgi:hypothetical protein
MKALDYIAASGPLKTADENLSLYAPLVGSWDVVSTWITASGAQSQASGEWHFQWILGGRGVQDVLFRSGSAPDTFGTTLRVYDSSLKAWRVTWMQPSGGEFVHLIGRKAGAEIVNEVQGLEAGRRERWRFSKIKADTFLWQDEVSLDDGVTWKVRQEMRGKRRG